MDYAGNFGFDLQARSCCGWPLIPDTFEYGATIPQKFR
jgi:hypothetical protein